MIQRPIYKIPVITQTHMHNYLNTDKRTVSQLGRGGANQVSPPFRIFPPPPLTWLQHVHDGKSSIKFCQKIPKFFVGASRIISNIICDYFLVFDLKELSQS